MCMLLDQPCFQRVDESTNKNTWWAYSQMQLALKRKGLYYAQLAVAAVKQITKALWCWPSPTIPGGVSLLVIPTTTILCIPSTWFPSPQPEDIPSNRCLLVEEIVRIGYCAKYKIGHPLLLPSEYSFAIWKFIELIDGLDACRLQLKISTCSDRDSLHYWSGVQWLVKGTSYALD